MIAAAVVLLAVVIGLGTWFGLSQSQNSTDASTAPVGMLPDTHPSSSFSPNSTMTDESSSSSPTSIESSTMMPPSTTRAPCIHHSPPFPPRPTTRRPNFCKYIRTGMDGLPRILSNNGTMNVASDTGLEPFQSGLIDWWHEDCGKRYRVPFNSSEAVSQERIFQGTEAQCGEYPWFTYLSIYSQNGYEGECSTTLINNRWILTAAHCIDVPLQDSPE